MAVSGSGLSQVSGGGSTSFSGCTVKLAADLTTQNFSTEAGIPFTEEVIDTDNFHDNSTNNTRITIPGSLDGYYGIITAHVMTNLVTGNSGFYFRIARNGTDDADNILVQGGDLIGTSFPSLTISTPPVLLSSGDYFEAWLRCTDTSISILEQSKFGIAILGN